MNAASKRAASFFISLIILAGTAVLYLFFVSPALDEIRDLRGRVSSERQTLDEQTEIFKRVQKLIDQYKGAKTLQDKLGLSLPNQPNVAQIVADLKGLASLNNLVITEVSTEVLPFRQSQGAPKYVKSLGSVNAILKIRGKYEDFKKFLSQLETNVRVMDLKKMETIGNADPKSLPDVMNFSLVVSSYYQ